VGNIGRFGKLKIIGLDQGFLHAVVVFVVGVGDGLIQVDNLREPVGCVEAVGGGF